MALAYLWTFMVAFSLVCGANRGLAAAAMEGAQAGITATISMAGGLCLWTGLARVMEKSGISAALARVLKPVLKRIFPKAAQDTATLGALSGNVTANLLGLGNAATPLGIEAAKRMKCGDTATDELCRLVVLNTASIQLLPTTVAAVRASLGAEAPFDILPAVWVTSLLSAGAGLTAAALFGRMRRG